MFLSRDELPLDSVRCDAWPAEYVAYSAPPVSYTHLDVYKRQN